MTDNDGSTTDEGAIVWIAVAAADLATPKAFRIANFAKDCFGETRRPAREVRAGLALRALPKAIIQTRKQMRNRFFGFVAHV